MSLIKSEHRFTIQCHSSRHVPSNPVYILREITWYLKCTRYTVPTGMAHHYLPHYGGHEEEFPID